MKLNLKAELIGWDNKPIPLDNGLHATIGRVICVALVGPEAGLSEEEIEKRFAFAGKLANQASGEYDLSSAELALVRARIRAHFQAPALVAPALRMLEIKGDAPTPATPG